MLNIKSSHFIPQTVKKKQKKTYITLNIYIVPKQIHCSDDGGGKWILIRKQLFFI